MKKLHLHNDNNKLHCRSFLHVSLYQGVDAWPLDQGYEIFGVSPHSGGRKGGFLGEVKLVDKRVSTVGKLNESIAAITTGFSLQVLKATLASSSDRLFPVTDDTKIHILTFRYLKYGQDHPLCAGDKRRARTPRQQTLPLAQ